MRILLINHRYFIASGAERYLFNVERMLQRSGHETAPFSIAYSRNEPSPWSSYFTSPIGDEEEVFFAQHSGRPATLKKAMERLFYSAEVERDLTRMINAFRPDVAYILLFRRKLSPSILWALKKAGVPIAVRVSDYSFLCEEHHFLRDGQSCTKCLDGRLLPGVVHACVRGSHAVSAVNALATYYQRRRGHFDLIDRFVTTNPFQTRMMIAGGYSPDRLCCIPTFVDQELFAPSQKPSKAYLLYMGRLDPSKGIDTLIDAMRILHRRSRIPPLPLRIVGEPQSQTYAQSLHRKVRVAGLGRLIRFDGAIPADAVPEVLRNAAASIIPSVWFENLPNVFLESLAAGIPVVASNLGSLASAIDNGEDGLLFTPGDPLSLADCIERLLTEPRLDARLRTAGRVKARTHYSAEAHLKRLIQLFTHLVGQASNIRSSAVPFTMKHS